MVWSRAAEFTCDRAAVLVSQDVNVVVSALLKLAGGSVSQVRRREGEGGGGSGKGGEREPSRYSSGEGTKEGSSSNCSRSSSSRW